LTSAWAAAAFAGPPAAGKTTTEDLGNDLVRVSTSRREPALKLTVVENRLTNRGTKTAHIDTVPLGNWTLPAAEGPSGPKYRPLFHMNDLWYGSTYWGGPDWTRVGKDWHHPGINTTAIRRFTSPRDGRVTITGRVYKLDPHDDGIRASVRHNNRTLWTVEIDGKDTKGVESKLSADVKKGDAIRFIVHKRDRINYDTTRWDPLVAFEDGPRFQASAGFSKKKQGENGWSYEMEVQPAGPTADPAVYSFATDLSLRKIPLNGAEPVKLTSEDSLPLVVIAGGGDRGGTVFAIAGAGPWQFEAMTATDRQIVTKLETGQDGRPTSIAAAESTPLPRVLHGSYEGSWMVGMAALRRALDSNDKELGLAKLRERLASAGCPELDLWAMLQTDWRGQDKLNGTPPSYAAAAAEHLRLAKQLLANLTSKTASPDGVTTLGDAGVELDRLAAEAKGLKPDDPRQRSHYLRVRLLKRRIALANPLLKFDKLLFCKRVPTSYSHLVMQYYGWRARPGGGLFVLDRPGRSLDCRDITGGRLAGGNVLEPRLSYDGRRIVFSYVKCNEKAYQPNTVRNEDGGEAGFYHIWEINVDGTGLRQLTDGPFDDLMPAYLPDGGIVFSSTRRRGYARCFGAQFSPRWDIYTLHRMSSDGKNLRMLSCHDTNEWFPTVGNDGRVYYARWDYIDRDAVTHQNLWSMRPDGTNPVTVWGNATASPHCSFQAKPIPGSGKFVFTASAHHSITAGSVALVDPAVDYDGQQAITRVTPQIPFPEAESRDIRQYYCSPWPLSEKYFLVAYSPHPLVWEPGANRPDALGIYLLDRFGNRELIYRDAEIGSTNPVPLVARPVPPIVPSDLPADAPPTGEMFLSNVYEGLGDVRRGSIKQLRIIHIFPKTTPLANNPPIGLAGEENGRAILGTVPVAPDGSAHFTVPALKPILFQALDKDGFAYQTMRSVTYVQPGERVSCTGCHESRMTAPVSVEAHARPMAMKRPPTDIDPGRFGGRPFSYVEVVQPVLDKHCVTCHAPGKKESGGIDLTGKPLRGFSASYWALCSGPNFHGGGTNPKNAAAALVPRFGQRNQVQVTPPGGIYGARGSRLIKLLRAGHEKVKLTPEELARIALWIDCNAIFYGVNLPADQARQLKGEGIEMPQVQ